MYKLSIILFVGNYLFEKLKDSDVYEVCFVWNRTADKMNKIVPVDLILDDLRQAHTRCGLVVNDYVYEGLFDDVFLCHM